MPATNAAKKPKYKCPVETKGGIEKCFATARKRHRPCGSCFDHHCWDCCVAEHGGCHPRGANCPEPPVTADCDCEIPEED